MVNLSAHQFTGHSRASTFLGPLIKDCQQDTVVAGTSEYLCQSPKDMLALIQDIEDSLVKASHQGQLEDEFDTTATVNSVCCDGQGSISILNGSIGDTETHIYMVDRSTGKVEILSHGMNAAPLKLGAASHGMINRDADNTTNSYDIKLQDGQELYILSCSDGIPVYESIETIQKSAVPFHEDIAEYLRRTPTEQIDIAGYAIEKAVKLGSKDNASATAQNFYHSSPKGNYLTAIFDADGGSPSDIEKFRHSLGKALKKHMGEISYIKNKEAAPQTSPVKDARTPGKRTQSAPQKQG